MPVLGAASPAGSAPGGQVGTPATVGTDLLGHGDLSLQAGRGSQRSCRLLPCSGAACDSGTEFTAWGEDAWVPHPQGTGDPGIFIPLGGQAMLQVWGSAVPIPTSNAAVGASASHDRWDAVFAPPSNKS